MAPALAEKILIWWPYLFEVIYIHCLHFYFGRNLQSTIFTSQILQCFSQPATQFETSAFYIYFYN